MKTPGAKRGLVARGFQEAQTAFAPVGPFRNRGGKRWGGAGVKEEKIVPELGHCLGLVQQLDDHVPLAHV